MTFLTIFDDNIYCPQPSDKNKAEIRINDWLKNISDNYDSKLSKQAKEFADSDVGNKLLLSIFGNSGYLSSLLNKDAEFFISMINKQSEISGFSDNFNHIIATLNNSNYKSIGQIKTALRIAKRQISLLIAIADITKKWDLSKVTWTLSIFAETCVQLACQFLLRDAHNNGIVKLANPNSPEVESGLVVLAMGKLGAFELNYSSDIDLIIFYENDKINYTGRQTEKHFFINIAQNLTDIMQDRTKDGYVFRTDLRLRPDPGSTPAAVSLFAAETYYETLGQNWERAAMIKARTIAGDAVSCEYFMKMIRPYIWRRSLDFQSIQDIHSIKRQIDAKQSNIPTELYDYNVKLGHGGIREIEFFVQTQQLIFGGRRPNLRTTSTCLTLEELVTAGETSQDVCDQLTQAYEFLRTLEHRLQMIDDQQTHTLPNSPEKMAAIAIFMGFDNTESFLTNIINTITMVKGHYAQLFNHSPSLAIELPEAYGNLVFTGTENDPETEKTMKRMGFKNVSNIIETIRGWHHGRRRATRTRRAREIITELMPALILAFSKSTSPDNAFFKFDEFLGKLPSGAQIFSLFYSNPRLLELIAQIMGSYPQIANDLSRNPALLDYVLAPEFYNALPKRAQLKKNITKAIGLEQDSDIETILRATSNWTNDRRFRVAIQLVKGRITHTEATRNLSRIADITVETLLNEITHDFTKKHGTIKGSNFAIIALGKLGGKELSFGSDLDIVFIYQTDGKHEESDGKKSLGASQYFTRLSRRFLTVITSPTREGIIYDIDIRLRPSGNDGPVATTLEAFEQYYGTAEWKGSAWAWEFMALTRARVITGEPEFRKKIADIIKLKLISKWDIDELNKGVLNIHQKLKESKYSDNPFAIKNVDGGLIDLEYIAQYLQLRHAYEHPEIINQNTRNALQAIQEADILNKKDTNILIEAERFYARAITAIRITETDIPKNGDLPDGIKKTLAKHTRCKDFKELQKKLVSTQKRVKKLLKTIIN